MPEIIKKPNGDIDYQKFFMGLAVAIVFVLQSYHSMKLNDLKQQVVPRAEYEQKHAKVMDKDEILFALQRLGDRLDAIEGKK